MKNNIVEVAIPISISFDESFDYLVPEGLTPAVKVGCRVVVPFRNCFLTGYVTKIKDHSKYEQKLKPVLRNLDVVPVLNKELFGIAAMLRDRYLCSLPDAIHTVIPAGLKNPKRLTNGIPRTKVRGSILAGESCHGAEEVAKKQLFNFNICLSKDDLDLLANTELQKQSILIHDLTNKKKWHVYAALIRQSLVNKKSVIFLVPDHQKILPAIEHLKLGIEPLILSSNINALDCKNVWMSVLNSDYTFVIGTRSAVFAPVANLGLIIIDEEDHFAYRQDQVPHYRTACIAAERARQYSAKLVLGSFMPSLGTFALIKKKSDGYLQLGEINKKVNIKLIDMRQERGYKARDRIISSVFEHRIADILEKKEKLLIFVNKKGFSTLLYCKKCKTIQTCPRCSASLIYHSKEKTVSCPKCPYSASALELCPSCKCSYVKYFGYGIEKVESELFRLFPSAKIGSSDLNKIDSCDIMLITQGFLENPNWDRHIFDTVAILSCEQMLGHVDFRSTEAAFSKLAKLLFLAKKEVLIQTRLLENNALNSLQRGSADEFYDTELKQRQELKLPPEIEMASLIVRSTKEKKALDAAMQIFKKLKKQTADSIDIELFEPTACSPLKVRGNYRYQILIKYRSLDAFLLILKKILANKFKGVITTFDPSPL